MNKINYLTLLLSVNNLISLVLSQTSLGPCDYKKYPSNGCEDELGADCDQDTSTCKCKPGNWVVVDNKFCFPVSCPSDQYYNHNLRACEPKRTASLNSEENYCRFDFHCRGNNIHCKQFGWNYRCVCNRGFIYDASTQQCQLLKGLNGFCLADGDCDTNKLRQFVCLENSCQCPHGFTYSHEIEGCEDNQRIKQRSTQTRTLIYIFIIMGLLFGAVTSMKFSYSADSTRQLLFKRVVESRQRQQQQQQQQNSSQLNSNERTVSLINNCETA